MSRKKLVAALSAAAGVALAGCTPLPPPGPVAPGADLEWQMSGVSSSDRAAYAQLGVAPSVARTFEQNGLTPERLSGWEAIEPSQVIGPYGRNDPVDAFLAYNAAGVTPDEVQPVVAAGGDLSNSGLVLKVIALNRAGYSYQRSLKYAEAGVGPDQVADYDRQQQEASQAAAAQKAAADKAAEAVEAQQAAAQLFVQQNCGGQVLNGADLLTASPYAIAGKCYQLGEIPVSQWISANQALADDFTVMIDADSPIPGQLIGPGIFIGEDPYQYESAIGASLTVYRLKEILRQNVVVPGA